MDLLEHENQPQEMWRDGVMTLMRVSALVKAHQLCIFEQFWADPGLGAPLHIHAVEEVLEVMEGICRDLSERPEQHCETEHLGPGFLPAPSTASRMSAPVFSRFARRWPPPFSRRADEDRAELSRRYTP